MRRAKCALALREHVRVACWIASRINKRGGETEVDAVMRLVFGAVRRIGPVKGVAMFAIPR
jgi:hypothetical protein